MFILSNIKIATTQITFFPHSRKYLKFQINKSTKKYPFPSKFINSHQIQWNIHQAFPEGLYDKSIFFEIYNKHQFGYHQQQLTSVLQGQIKIEKNMTFNSFEVYRVCDQKLVGSLSCNIRHRFQVVAQPVVEARSARDQVLMIKSIAVHLPRAANKKIYCRLKVAKQEFRTSSVRSFAGEIMFTDPMVFDKNELDLNGILTIFEQKGINQSKVGQGNINLSGDKPDKKVTILDLDEKLLGEAYIDCFQQFKDQDPRLKSNSLPNYLSKTPSSRGNSISRESMARLLSSFRKSTPFPDNPASITSRNSSNPEFIGTRSSITNSKISMGQIRQNRHLNKTYKNSLFQIEEQSKIYKNNLPMIWGRY